MGYRSVGRPCFVHAVGSLSLAHCMYKQVSQMLHVPVCKCEAMNLFIATMNIVTDVEKVGLNLRNAKGLEEL